MLPVRYVQEEIQARMDQTHYLKTHHNYIHIPLAVLAGKKKITAILTDCLKVLKESTRTE